MEKLTVDSFDPMALDDLWPTPEDLRKEDPDFEKDPSEVEDGEDPVENIFDEEPVEPKKRGGRKKKVEEAAPPAENEQEVPKKRGRKKAAPVVTNNEQSEEKPKPRRGRPPKEKVEGEEEKPKLSPVSIDDLEPDVLNTIFNKYSNMPISELANEVNLTEKNVQKVIRRLQELFEGAIAGGDLTEEKYNEHIAPKFEQYIEKSGIEQFVMNTISNI